MSVVCESTDCAGESEPVETFSLLANEDRLAILKAVVHADERGETPLSFSTLREAVDIRDSGRFSYHLRELTDHFLTHSADGYSLHGDCCDRLVAVVASIDI
jgi:DNA-binding transcriptional ArsR family regulator